MFAHVDLELAPRTTPFPIQVIVAHPVEEQPPAQIKIADQSAAQVCNVAYVVAASPQRREKFNGDGSGHVILHGDGHGKWNQPHLPVGKNHGCGKHDSVNSSRRSNGGNRHRYPGAVGIEQRLDQDVDATGAYSRQEKINVKTVGAPGALQVRAKHPKEEHVEQQVPDAAVQKYICQRLPKPQAMRDQQGHQAKFLIHSYRDNGREKKQQERLHQKRAGAGDYNISDRGGQHSTPTDSGAGGARVTWERTHRLKSKRGWPGSQSEWQGLVNRASKTYHIHPTTTEGRAVSEGHLFMKVHANRPAGYRWIISFFFLFLAFPGAGNSQSTGLKKLFSDYYEFRLREDPGQATFVGRADYNDRWDDPSPEHMRQYRDSMQQFVRRLKAIPDQGLSARDHLSYRLLDWQLQHEIAEVDVMSTYFTVNQMVGGHIDILSAVAVAPAKTVKDYEDQLSRIRALPRWVDRTIAAANLSIAEKKVQPRLVAQRMIGQLDIEMPSDPMQSPLLSAFTKFPASIPAAEQGRLEAAALDAYTHSFLPAWHKLRDYIADTYIPAARDSLGISDLPGGSQMYAFLVAQMTTTNYTPEQIHEIGLKEVTRIESEMLKIRQQLNFTGTAAEFSEQVLNAPRFQYHSGEEILIHARDIAKRIDPELPHLFKVLPRMTYGVAAIPLDRAATDSSYYEYPALDGSRAGYFYLKTTDPEKQSSCCLESTILHEAVPGHHLQIALANEIPDMPDFRKIYNYDAYTEGWALYAETLGSALHMYENPYEMYGYYQGQILRATRLVVDTGIHTQGWSREKAINYMYDAGADPSRDYIASEVDRYIAWPGQSLSYMIGQIKIQELRALAEKELGPKFDIRTFHDVVLRNGTLPLDILDEQVRDWIAHSR